MRRILLLLVIALLPLRAWAGDIMATEMAALAGNPVAAMPCHDAAANDDMPLHDKAPTHASVCAHCDVCHAVAFISFDAPALPHAPGLTRSAPARVDFHSAALARGLKPPIA